MRVERISMAKISAAKYNPRKDLKPGDPEYEKLKRSVERWDLVEPLVWNERTGTLVGGHQRLKILAARGDTEVDVSIVDLDERDEQALNVALNRIQGEWDEPKLADILAGLNMDGFDATVTGFDMAELERIVAANTEVEDEGEVDLTPPKKPKSRRGEVYELGPHRLMCGDAADKRDADQLLENKHIDAIITDPPYGIEREGVPADDPNTVLALYVSTLNVSPIKDGILIAFQSPRMITNWLEALRQTAWNFERFLWSYKPNGIRFPWRGWILKSDIIAAAPPSSLRNKTGGFAGAWRLSQPTPMLFAAAMPSSSTIPS